MTSTAAYLFDFNNSRLCKTHKQKTNNNIITQQQSIFIPYTSQYEIKDDVNTKMTSHSLRQKQQQQQQYCAFMCLTYLPNKQHETYLPTDRLMLSTKMNYTASEKKTHHRYILKLLQQIWT